MIDAHGDDPITWVRCPECGAKTRVKIREDTILRNFPLFCPKCKRTFLIDAQHCRIECLSEPDAQTQSPTKTKTVVSAFTCKGRDI